MSTNPQNITALIQARMGSTRLPGKVMKTIAGRPLLDIQLERVKNSKLIDTIVVATSDLEQDQVIQQYCLNKGVVCFCGNESNVLKRFYDASLFAKADLIVRLTADCPIIDAEIIDKTIQHYLDNVPQFEYVSNVHPRTFPRGMDVEVFSVEALHRAFEKAQSSYEAEHVTPYIIKNSRCGNFAGKQDLSRFRLTVDTPEDFEVVRRIFLGLYPFNPAFNLKDIITYMDDNPAIYKINEMIEQKRENEN